MTPDIVSPSATVVDLTSHPKWEKETLTISPPADRAIKSPEAVDETGQEGAKVKLSQRKKWTLLAVFSLAMFVDGELFRTPFSLGLLTLTGICLQSGVTRHSSSSLHPYPRIST